ncbi:hypothetical protein FHR22_002929 [Sphingopyxis panaciterrae]|uniref:hypothetical protein n=1 Tax=Sphingopyxis panaciterrae TaxID=363841 RepID=UPI00141EA05A|nr:hypothetical protein [Sphingopyxis panaciterrae]NIJ38218.1 hypothetical protein [Sphingopyxis panaciterrae]
MFLAAVMLVASAAAPLDIGFDRAMADKQCAADVKAEDLDGRIECLDYQLRGRRLWVLVAADRGREGAADMESCSSRWTEDGVTDWRMAGSCLTEAGDPLAAARGKRDFDEKGLHALCSEAGDPGLPPPPSSENRSPVEECVFDNAVDYRIFQLLEKTYRGAIGKSFAYCRSNWTEDGVINWRMAELCGQLQIRAWERLADWR